MNSIFSAQGDRVPIDACLLGPGDSPFLQQARPDHPAAYPGRPCRDILCRSLPRGGLTRFEGRLGRRSNPSFRNRKASTVYFPRAQACNITGGIYLRPQSPQGFVQYLLTVFACDLLTRSSLRLPHAASVDFRASCFCHKARTARRGAGPAPTNASLRRSVCPRKSFCAAQR